MALAIANRYVQALAEVVEKPGSPVEADAVPEQLESFASLLKDSAELRNVLSSPAVSAADKRGLIVRLGERLELAAPVVNFLSVVIDHRRMNLIGEMIGAFRQRLREQRGVVKIHVSSAHPLDEPRREKVLERFGQVTGMKVEADFATAPALWGGAVVRNGSLVFDGSLRAQLAALERVLMGEH